MQVDYETLETMAENLEFLLEDMPSKPREVAKPLVKRLQNNPDVEELLKIQDELEAVSNMPNVDSFTRNEMMNVITELEELINS